MKIKSMFAAAALGVVACGGAAQAQCPYNSVACGSSGDWGMMNYGVPYASYNPYAETSENWAAHAGAGLYGANLHGQTHVDHGTSGGSWMNVARERYDVWGRLDLSRYGIR